MKRDTLVLILFVSMLAAIITMNVLSIPYEREAGLLVLIIAVVVTAVIMLVVRLVVSLRQRDEVFPEGVVPQEPRRKAHLLPLIILAVALIFEAAAAAYLGRLDETMIALGVLLVGVAVVSALIDIGSSWASRGWVEQAVVCQLAAVVRQHLPLPTAVALAARSERGLARLVLNAISKRLSEGWPLSQAILLGYPSCPSLVTTLVIAGERAGQLPAALEQADDYVRARATYRQMPDVNILPYMLIVFIFAGLLIAGEMVTVVPKFKEIFKDFEVALPASTQYLISISRFLVDSGLLAGLTILTVIGIGMAAYLKYRPRGVARLSLLSRAGDWIRWQTPGWGRLERGQGLAVAARVLRWGLRSGMDLAPALRIAWGVDMNHNLRRRLRRCGDFLERGVPPGEAARKAGLGEVTALALASGQRSGDMDAALRYLSGYHEGIISRWIIVLRNLTWPLGTLLMGVVVGAVVYAMFEPLIVLIDATMEAL